MADEKTDEKDSVKKRKSRIETENKILDAALSIFSEVGYESASIQAIAARANVNGALIIRYFGSKSELLQAIIRQGCEGSFSDYACNPPAATLEEEIARFFLSEIKVDYEHHEFLRLVFVRATLDPEIESMLATLHPSDGRADLANCLKVFKERGEIAQDVDPMQLSYILHLHALGFGTTVHLQPTLERKRMEDHARFSAKIISDGLRAEAERSRGKA